MGLVPGVVLLNLILLGVGYTSLAPALRGSSLARWASWAGVALLVGAGLSITGMFVAATAGATTGPLAFGLVAAVLAATGIAFAWRGPVLLPSPSRTAPADGRARLVTLVAGYGVVAIMLSALVGGFRSTPWLDDVWGIWLPKGIALDHHGLDSRLFGEGGRYVTFEVLDYPLWWSILGALEMRFVGDIDLRAINAQLAMLTAAFVAAVARLLHGIVRPWLLAVGLLLVVACPELLRQVQGGVADLPVAYYLALALLAAVLWLTSRRRFYLVLLFVFGTAAIAIKSEGLPQLALFLAVISAFAWTRARTALPALWAAAGLAVATAIPWAVWRAANDVKSQVGLADAFDPSRLLDRTERIGPAAETLLRHLVSPREWLLVVPLAVVLSLALAVRARRVLWLAPAALIAAGLGFWIFAYWTESEDLGYLLSTSSYRVVDALVLTAGLAVLVQAELLLRLRSGDRREALSAEVPVEGERRADPATAHYLEAHPVDERDPPS